MTTKDQKYVYLLISLNDFDGDTVINGEEIDNHGAPRVFNRLPNNREIEAFMKDNVITLEDVGIFRILKTPAKIETQTKVMFDD